MKKFYQAFLLVCCSGLLKAQELPFNYLQTSQNLYLSNPAFAAQSRQQVLSLNYHRQQIGSIDLVPQYSTIAFTSPLGDTRSNVGAAVYHYSRSYFVTNGFRASFAHAVPLATEQFLYFGVTGGGSYSLLDVNIEDPLVNQYNKSFQPEAEFGVAYHGKGLEIGGALTNLLGNGLQNKEESYSFYTNYFVHAAFTLPVGVDWKVKPFAAYRTYTVNDISTEGVEGNITVTYKDFIMAGGGWREEQGPYATAGVQVKNINISGAYKLASGNENASNPAMEIQARWFFGRKREGYTKKVSTKKNEATYAATLSDTQKTEATSESKSDTEEKLVKQESVKGGREDALVSNVSKQDQQNDTSKPSEDKLEPDLRKDKPVTQTAVVSNNTVKAAEQPSIEKVATNVQNTTSPEVANTPRQEVKANTNSDTNITPVRNVNAYVEQIDEAEHKTLDNEISAGYYVVVSAFKKKDNLNNYIRQMAQQGFDVSYNYSSDTRFYYAYLTKVSSISEGQLKLAVLRDKEMFKDAWLLSVNQLLVQSQE